MVGRRRQRTRRARAAGAGLVFALGVGALAACGSSDDGAAPVPAATGGPQRSTTTAAPAADPPATTTAASRGRSVPRTVFALSDLEDRDDPEIATLLSYYEGGDNHCADVPEDTVLDQPTIVDAAFRDSTDIQIGWWYVMCWTWMGSDSLELYDPSGERVPDDREAGPFPLPPGSPTGTYTAVGVVEGERHEATVEVVPAREERLYPVGAPSGCPDRVDAFLVGFRDVDEVTLAAYEQAEDPSEPAALLGTATVPVDDDGSAALTIEPGDGPPGRVVTIVADPVTAGERWGTDPQPTVPGLMELDIPQQLAFVTCIGAA